MSTKSIFKYPLSLDSARSAVKLPSGTELLSVQFQGNELMLWALVDAPLKDIVARQFLAIGTGWILGQEELEGFAYFTTVQNQGYVWHIWFEKI